MRRVKSSKGKPELNNDHCLPLPQIQDKNPIPLYVERKQASQDVQLAGENKEMKLTKQILDVLTWDNNSSKEATLHMFMLLVCSRGDVAAAQQVASALGNDATKPVTDRDGNTPLHAACSKGHLEVVVYLITQLHANLNVLDNRRCTPLQIAIQNKHFEVSQYLRQITMGLALVAQELNRENHPQAIAYARSSHAILNFGNKVAIGREKPVEREQVVVMNGSHTRLVGVLRYATWNPCIS